MVKKENIFSSLFFFSRVIVIVLLLNLIAFTKFNQKFIVRAIALPTEVTVVAYDVNHPDGVYHHVRNISRQACVIESYQTLFFSKSSDAYLNTWNTAEFGNLYTSSSLYYHYGPFTGGGGVVKLKKAAGCWEVTIGENSAEYITVTN